GIRPLARPGSAQAVHSISREHKLLIGPTGVFHVLGVKLTDHRRAAEEIVAKLARQMKRRERASRKSPTRKIPL
ncbi:MAG: glycerol-3-phosphate dehydrogenase, partial [Candidatus Omnitrophota bacterium]